MSKSIKLKNNTYIDSSGITHNRDLLSTLLTTLTGQVSNILNQVTNLNNRIYIQEAGSNSNGNYIKFSNGILVCYVTKTYRIAITNAWGSLYESARTQLGTWPVAFIEAPVMAWACVKGTSVWLEAVAPTNTSIGNSWFMRPVGEPNAETTMTYIAIGKWK